MTQAFPSNPEFSGAMHRPSRVEAELVDLEVAGTLPAGLRGVFYQVAPDPQYPPLLGSDTYINGDGMVKAFRFESNRVSLRSRYVQTERLLAQRKHGRSLNGIYRNRYTNDPLAADNNTTANTAMLFFNGQLLALKEDALPHRLDPETLETLDTAYDFDGQVQSQTFTAHPKIDPRTGNLVAFAYEAKGDGSHDAAFFEFSPDGKLIHQIWFKVPLVCMIHDCAITENHIILPHIMLTADVERMKAGGQHWQWAPKEEVLFAVIPRRGSARDVRWFKGPKDFYLGHVVNAFEVDRVLYVDTHCVDGNPWPNFPDEDGFVPSFETLQSDMRRWVFKLGSASDRVESFALSHSLCEFGRCDPRRVGQDYSHAWMLALDPSRPYDDTIEPRYPFLFFNVLAQYNVKTKQSDLWFAGPTRSFQEPVFVPRSSHAPEGDGYVMALVNNLGSEATDLAIMDTRQFAEGPVATVRIPFRLRASLHGTWVPAV